jgi:hypothetical protein
MSMRIDEESSATEIAGALDNLNNEDDDSGKGDTLEDVLWPVSPAEIIKFYTTFESLMSENNERGVSRIEHFLYIQDSRG